MTDVPSRPYNEVLHDADAELISRALFPSKGKGQLWTEMEKVRLQLSLFIPSVNIY